MRRIGAPHPRPAAAEAYVSSNQLVVLAGFSAATVNAALVDLQRFGIVEDVTGRRRGRAFGYLAISSEGTDPLPMG